jgi:predicted Zn finger-like uncharacterized protein
MKITCQACQSKYTIADDKIQGKVAKIRCRKCGATVLVDASAGTLPVNGAAVAVSGDTWSVSVAEGDQRSMQLQEVIDAYNTGVITVDTYVWKEGMGDWQPLAEVPAIVEALNRANDAESAAVEPLSAAVSVTAEPESMAASQGAARKETTGRNRDLFGRGAADEEVATSVAPNVLSRGGAAAGVDASGQLAGGGLTGARDEHSVLFSLTALTNNNAGAMGGSGGRGTANNDDSGLIDLNALAQAQQTRTAEGAASSPLYAPPSPFLFPAALGTVEAPPSAADSRKKSYLPVMVGGAIAVVAVAAAFALLAGDSKKEDVASASPPVPAAVAPTANAEPAPAPTSSVAAPDPNAPQDPAAAASAKASSAKKPAPAVPRPASRPAPPPAAVAPPAPAAPKPKASPCGCAPGDLQCQIRCSATGH